MLASWLGYGLLPLVGKRGGKEQGKGTNKHHTHTHTHTHTDLPSQLITPPSLPYYPT